MSPFVRLAAVRLGDRLCAKSVLLLALGALTLTLSSPSPHRVAELDFQTARSFALGHAGDLSGTPETERLLADDALLWAPAEGEVRSARPVGGPLASVPLYWFGMLLELATGDLEARSTVPDEQRRTDYLPHLVVTWKSALLAAITAWMIVLSARRIGVGRRHAWLAGLAFVFATYVWPEARGSSIDVQAAFLLFLSFHLLLRARERFERLRRPRRLDLLVLGAALGTSFATRPELWGAVAVLFASCVAALFAGYRRLARYALFLRQTWRFGHWSDLAWLSVPFLVALALTAVANQARSGSVLGPPGELWPAASSDPAADLALLVLAPGRGVLWLAPLVLLAPLGLLLATRTGERLWPLGVVLVCAPIVWFAHRPLTATEPWGFGPGRLLAALPFLWLGVAYALDRVSKVTWARRTAHLLAVFGVVVNLSGVLVGPETVRALVTDLVDVEAIEPADETERAGELYRLAHWTPRYAQPWANWRILRHRMAGLGEEFQSRQVFFAERNQLVSLERERHRGFRHMAWIDLRDRLHTPPYPGVLLALLFIAAGTVYAVRGLDRALP